MESPKSADSGDSLEKSLTLPTYAQNFLPAKERPTLLLISHSHAPPLNPAPDLRFDLRNVPNPPKNIRDAHNGTSKRLQEWLQTDKKFISKRDSIKKEIKEAMTQMTNGAQSDFHEDEKVSRQGSGAAENDDSSPDVLKVLRVGIFCEMGRHRSVAMVEELSRVPWDRWCMEVQHRDIDKKRGIFRNGKKGKSSRRTRGGAVTTDELSE